MIIDLTHFHNKNLIHNFLRPFLKIAFLFFVGVHQVFSHFSYTASPLRPNLQKYLPIAQKIAPQKKEPTKISLHALTKIIENKYGIPENLLMAIAYVESKCHPYAINARQRGYYFKSKKDAVSFVKDLRAQGVRNINVGLMQLNVPSHIHKFRTIDDMLDISRNIHFAAKLLSRLYQNYGSWTKAVERYKSSFCEESRRYQQYVYSMRGRVKNHRVITLDDQTGQTPKASSLSKRLIHMTLPQKQKSVTPHKYNLSTSPWTLCGYQNTSLLQKLSPYVEHLSWKTTKRLSKKINESSLHVLTNHARLPSWGQTFTFTQPSPEKAVAHRKDYAFLWDEEIL